MRSERTEDFIREVAVHRTPAELDVVKRIISWCAQKGLREEFGGRVETKGVPFWPRVPELEGLGSSPFQLWSKSGEGLTLAYKALLTRKPFNIEGKRVELRTRIDSIPGVDPKEHWPSVSLSALTDPSALKELLTLTDWIINSLRRANRGVRL